MSEELTKPGDVLIEGIRWNKNDALQTKVIQALKISNRRSEQHREARRWRNKKIEDTELDQIGL